MPLYEITLKPPRGKVPVAGRLQRLLKTLGRAYELQCVDMRRVDENRKKARMSLDGDQLTVYGFPTADDHDCEALGCTGGDHVLMRATVSQGTLDG